MALPILYTFRRCPYAIRARMGLAYAGIAFEIREVVLRDKPEAMLSLSPKGTVPVLQLIDKTILEESLDIMHWALQQTDPENWYPDDAALRADIDRLIATNDDDFKPSLDGFKYPDQNPERTADEHREAACHFLDELEARLNKSAYLCGDHITLADVALFPFVRQFSRVDLDWFNEAPYPKLRVWLHGWLESPLFKSIMAKYPQWATGQDPLEFKPGKL